MAVVEELRLDCGTRMVVALYTVSASGASMPLAAARARNVSGASEPVAQAVGTALAMIFGTSTATTSRFLLPGGIHRHQRCPAPVGRCGVSGERR